MTEQRVSRNNEEAELLAVLKVFAVSDPESEAESSGVVDDDPGDEAMGTRESVLTAGGEEEDSTEREREREREREMKSTHIYKGIIVYLLRVKMLRTESKLVEDLQYYCTFAVSSAINSSRMN